MTLQPSDSRPPIALIVSLYIGFAITGIGTTLLGCVLPALSSSWNLSYSHSGFLIAAQFAGSSSGSLFVQTRLYRSLTGGYLLLLIASVLVAFCHGNLAPLLLFCFGLGLGSSMTSTSMLIGCLYPTRRGAALSLVNAIWGLGAVFTPGLATIWERHYSAITVYVGVAFVIALLLIAFAFQLSHLTRIRTEISAASDTHARWQLLALLAVFAFLYVGVESSMGGWMMTYIDRLLNATTLYAPVITTCFWTALLSGRLVAPVILRYISEERLLAICICTVIVSNTLLLLSHTPAMSLISATLSGLMLAPIFPLFISKVLAIASRPSESKWVFGISGLGGAALPWLTGQLATMRDSLRIGLAVPLAASCIMLLLQIVTHARIERQSLQQN